MSHTHTRTPTRTHTHTQHPQTIPTLATWPPAVPGAAAAALPGSELSLAITVMGAAPNVMVDFKAHL